MKSMYWHWRWMHRMLAAFGCLCVLAMWYVGKDGVLFSFAAGAMLLQALEPIDKRRALGSAAGRE